LALAALRWWRRNFALTLWAGVVWVDVVVEATCVAVLVPLCVELELPPQPARSAAAIASTEIAPESLPIATESN
jgi:hypothetical protein